MSRELPEWQAYDPASSPLPDIRGSTADARGGAVIVLLEAPGVREEGWGARAAASLASKLARAGRRVFLADLDIVRPSLHRVLGVANDEGVSDAFVYGASIQHVAQAVDDGRYFFAPAGTVLGSPGALASSARWDPVLEGFRTARADVVLLVPSDQDGVERILDRATDVVVLGGPDESVDGSLAPDRVRAVLGPAAPAPPPAATRSAVAPRPESFPDVPPPPRGRGRGDGDPSVVPAATARGRAPRRADEKARPGPVRLVLLLLLLLASLAAAWWLGALDVPGLPTPADADASPAPVAGAGGATAPPPVPVLAASLALESFEDPALARLQRDALSERRPDLLFVVAPVEVDGRIFHRLLVGPATDSAGAAELRGSLSASLPGEDPGRWVVRATPLAFRLDELDSAEAARARVEEIRGLDIPAYVLEVPTASGAVRHRVYAGAFADGVEAAWLYRRLTERGIADAVLTERAGRAPAAPSPE